MSNLIQPTPYPDVNIVLDMLLSNAQVILSEHFVGMYLYGSLASGDFNLHTSDIDFVVVTDGELIETTIAELQSMHTSIWASGLKWATKLEGAYIPQRTLRRHGAYDMPCPAINEGKFYIAHLHNHWVIQRHILREQGIVLIGPSLKALIDPIQPIDLKRAVIGILLESWVPMLQNPARLLDHGYQPFAILSMCRALYTFQHGTIVSKPVAGRWAKDTLNEQWASLIEQALLWQGDTPFNHLDETLAFIRFTTEHSQQLNFEQ